MRAAAQTTTDTSNDPINGLIVAAHGDANGSAPRAPDVWGLPGPLPPTTCASGEVLFLRERESPTVVSALLAGAPASLAPFDLVMHGLETTPCRRSLAGGSTSRMRPSSPRWALLLDTALDVAHDDDDAAPPLVDVLRAIHARLRRTVG